MGRRALRMASLFSGTGALDLAVQEVFGGRVVWHSQYEPPDRKTGRPDTNQYAARILARHWPGVPNLGDITAVCWACVLARYGPIDILCGGFPCTDVSSAGQRAGLLEGTRSGLWNHFVRAIAVLRPRIVVIENVEGLLSAPADRGLELGAEALDEEAEAGRVLRALGAVLGDLATLGFDAEWVRLAASEVGAAHPRKRVFIVAWPAAVDAGGVGWGDGPRLLRRLGTAGRNAEAPADADSLEPERRGVSGVLGGQTAAESGEGDQRERAGDTAGHSCAAAADAANLGHEGARGTRRRGDRLADSGVEAVCPTCGCDESDHDQGGFCAGCGRCTDANLGRPGGAATDTDGRGLHAPGELPAGRDTVRRGVREDAPGRGTAPADTASQGRQGRRLRGRPAVPGEPSAADTAGVGRGEGWPEPARFEGRLDASERGGASAPDTAGDTGRLQHGDRAAAPDADQLRRRADVLDLRPGEPDVDWGDYGPAIRRHERVFGRPAPWPTDALGRLSAVFTEWLMGMPDGWVTCTPGLNRNAMLKALGNGVVPLQAVVALRHLAGRIGWTLAA